MYNPKIWIETLEVLPREAETLNTARKHYYARIMLEIRKNCDLESPSMMMGYRRGGNPMARSWFPTLESF